MKNNTKSENSTLYKNEQHLYQIRSLLVKKEMGTYAAVMKIVLMSIAVFVCVIFMMYAVALNNTPHVKTTDEEKEEIINKATNVWGTEEDNTEITIIIEKIVEHS